MNFHSYGTHYGHFRRCIVSSVQKQVMIFDFASAPYEGWLMIRMHPPEKVYVDCRKPFLLALKAFFKSDVPASVVCNDKYLWTACLGNERVVFPVSRDVKHDPKLQLYATPFYVQKPDVVRQYLASAIGPAYDNVFFYRNMVLYLDNQDVPYPGGCYFDPRDPNPHYRICLLSDGKTEDALRVALEWKERKGVECVPYMTRDVKVAPLFIDFRPVSDHGFVDAAVASTGLVYKRLSPRKAEHVIQDVLNSYVTNTEQRTHEGRLTALDGLGLFIEWPFWLSHEGAQNQNDEERAKRFVALSVNGAHPDRVLYVIDPYERYVEYHSVPATLWTPVSFVSSTLVTEAGVRKVAIDTCVVGLAYRNAFFCLSEPLLEGVPTRSPLLNAQHILSPAAFDLGADERVTVVQAFRYNGAYSLRRVKLEKCTLNLWCLVKASRSDPSPKCVSLPNLVQTWLDFFMEVDGKDAARSMGDVNVVRLALMLSKHHICFNLNTAVKGSSEPVRVQNNVVHFNLEEEVVQFINDARLLTREKKTEEGEGEGGWACSVS